MFEYFYIEDTEAKSTRTYTQTKLMDLVSNKLSRCYILAVA
jgi:hypothetical protein